MEDQPVRFVFTDSCPDYVVMEFDGSSGDVFLTDYLDVEAAQEDNPDNPNTYVGFTREEIMAVAERGVSYPLGLWPVERGFVQEVDEG